MVPLEDAQYLMVLSFAIGVAMGLIIIWGTKK